MTMSEVGVNAKFMDTYSSAPGTNTVDELGFDRTVPTALSNEAFRSFNNFVCCASRRSARREKGKAKTLASCCYVALRVTKTKKRSVHCSMIGANATSLLFRSTSRCRRISCHDASAMVYTSVEIWWRIG